jgi:hypothetical protein
MKLTGVHDKSCIADLSFWKIGTVKGCKLNLSCILKIFHLMWIKFDPGNVHADLSCDYELHKNRCSKSCSFLERVNESTFIVSITYDCEKHGVRVLNMM